MKKIIILFLLALSSLFAFEQLTVDNINEKLKGKNAIIDFYATWCPPCKIIDKHLTAYDAKKPENVIIYKVDIDAQRALVTDYNIKSIPTLLFVQDGKIVYSKIGVQSLKEIEKNSQKYLQ